MLLGEKLMELLDQGYILASGLLNIPLTEEGMFFTAESPSRDAIHLYRNEAKTNHILTLYMADPSESYIAPLQKEDIRMAIGIVRPSLPIRIAYKRYCGRCHHDFRLFQIVEYVPIDNDSFCSSCIAEIRKDISVNTVPSLFLGGSIINAKDTVLTLLDGIVESNEWDNDVLCGYYEDKYPGEWLSGNEGLLKEIQESSNRIADNVAKKKNSGPYD